MKGATLSNLEDYAHFSIDLETFSTAQNAYITAIGAAMFAPSTGMIVGRFYCVCHCSYHKRYDIDPATINWWLGQNDEARKSLCDVPDYLTFNIHDALHNLSKFLTTDMLQPVVWGNGATFDISILENAYNTEGLQIPWKFYNIRDMRTIIDMALSLPGGADALNLERMGTAHNAIDDAEHQARLISAAYQFITMGKVADA